MAISRTSNRAPLRTDTARQEPVRPAAPKSKPTDTFQISPSWERRLRSLAQSLDAWINHTEKPIDGFLLGAGGKPFPPGTPLSQLPATEPQGGRRNDRTIIYANGALITHRQAAVEMQAVASSTGSRVIGLYNATESPWDDAGQVLDDEFDVGDNKAVDSLAGVVYGELKAGRDVDLFGHSQGGVIGSRALTRVRERLVSDGMSPEEAEATLGRVRFETFGAAAYRYPDGPKYTHWINDRDLAPTLLGLDHGHNPLAHAGRGAVIHHFRAAAGSFITQHSLQETYLRERERELGDQRP
jgi:hypothetical protein